MDSVYLFSSSVTLVLQSQACYFTNTGNSGALMKGEITVLATKCFFVSMKVDI